MWRILVGAVILWGFASSEARAQGVLFFLDGGASFPNYRYETPARAPQLSTDMGYYFGFRGLVLSRKDRRPMLDVQMGIQSLSKEWFVRIQPGLSYLPDFGRGFHGYSHLGFGLNFPLHNGYRSYLSLDPALGIGYRGLVLKGGYQWGFTPMINESFSQTGAPGTKGRVHVFTLGLSLSPQVLFPSAEQKRNP